jgi:uncharacterized membrane protein YjjP (DUF1212 family)
MRMRWPDRAASLVDDTVDVALRLGAVLLSCGAPTPDVQAAVFTAGRALGLSQIEVDINYSSITVSTPRSGQRDGQTAVRVVRTWHVNHARLAAAHVLMLDLSAGRLDLDQTLQLLSVVETTQPRYGRWLVTGAFGVLAAAIVTSLGGDVLTAAVSFCSAVLVEIVSQRLSRHEIPAFFLNAGSALIASMVAVGLTAVDTSAPSALVVAGGIMALLPGMSLVVAAQEAIGRFPVTAGARLVELTAATAGIVAGVLGALFVADKVGVTMVGADRFAGGRGLVGVAIVAGGIAAGACSATSRSPAKMFLPAAVTGVLGVAVLHAAARFVGNGGATATAVSAVVVGVVAQLLAGRYQVPAVLIVAPGIIPLLPGLTLYRSLLEFSQGQTTVGTADLIEAGTIAVALASGVLLGEILSGGPRHHTRVRAGRRTVTRRYLRVGGARGREGL